MNLNWHAPGVYMCCSMPDRNVKTECTKIWSCLGNFGEMHKWSLNFEMEQMVSTEKRQCGEFAEDFLGNVSLFILCVHTKNNNLHCAIVLTSRPVNDLQCSLGRVSNISTGLWRRWPLALCFLGPHTESILHVHSTDSTCFDFQKHMLAFRGVNSQKLDEISVHLQTVNCWKDLID